MWCDMAHPEFDQRRRSEVDDDEIRLATGCNRADVPVDVERFRRGGNVAGRIAGSGLGLWGSQRIVAQHGGTIAIDSTEGKGTIVTVRLPLEVNDDMPNDPPPAPIETTATRGAD